MKRFLADHQREKRSRGNYDDARGWRKGYGTERRHSSIPALFEKKKAETTGEKIL